jgi:uncharacterized membrane protein (DUF441 family)
MGLALTLARLIVLGIAGSVVVVWLAITNVPLAALAAVVVAALLIGGIVLVARAAGSPTRPPE